MTWLFTTSVAAPPFGRTLGVSNRLLGAMYYHAHVILAVEERNKNNSVARSSLIGDVFIPRFTSSVVQ